VIELSVCLYNRGDLSLRQVAWVQLYGEHTPEHTTLDRCRYHVLYFSHTRHLSATGLIRVPAGCLRLPTRRSHSETLQGLVHSLREQPRQLLIWFDEAHELADENRVGSRITGRK
jgi:hypothetical protein